MQFDPLNDALAKLFNAEQAGKFNVDLAPASKLLGSVLELCKLPAMSERLRRTTTDEEANTSFNYAEQSTIVA